MEIKPFHLRWLIDIDATSPEAAAEMAQQIQRDPQSIANIFEVYDDKGNFIKAVDLDHEPLSQQLPHA